MPVYFYLIREGSKIICVTNKTVVYYGIRHSNFFISDFTESGLFAYTRSNLMIIWKLEFRRGLVLVSSHYILILIYKNCTFHLFFF